MLLTSVCNPRVNISRAALIFDGSNLSPAGEGGFKTALNFKQRKLAPTDWVSARGKGRQRRGTRTVAKQEVARKRFREEEEVEHNMVGSAPLI